MGYRVEPRFGWHWKSNYVINERRTMTGVVKVLKEGYGFLSPDDGSPDAFFHRNALAGLTFDELVVGQRVMFETINSDRGPRASNVRAID